MNDSEKQLKAEIKKEIDKVNPYSKDTKIINAMVRFILKDREKRA